MRSKATTSNVSNNCDVRYSPESRHQAVRLRCLLGASCDISRRSKNTQLFDHLVGAGE